jgi:phospholipid/cholesterol/gamma-HCH transport system substrate-binding protein
VKILDKRTSSDLVKLVIFIVITALATGLLVVTIGNLSFGSTSTYQAVFTDATGLNSGDDVRIAGVKVGTVKKVAVDEQPASRPGGSPVVRAMVTFSVDSDDALDRATHATIRYRNLIGQRYIALSDEIGNGALLTPGSTIPVAQTAPALDLSVLFNGFKPLFQALSPDDINTLSYEIIQVFQGEGGSVDDLLAQTASLTSTLADHDKVINALIDNLNQVLDHIGKRDTQLSHLIVTLRTFVHGLSQDKNAILGSLDQISDLSVQVAGLVNGVKDPFANDIRQIDSFAGDLDRDKAGLSKELQIEPLKLAKIGATADYGSWFNFYLCGFHGNVSLPGNIKVPVNYDTNSSRCNLG